MSTKSVAIRELKEKLDAVTYGKALDGVAVASLLDALTTHIAEEALNKTPRRDDRNETPQRDDRRARLVAIVESAMEDSAPYHPQPRWQSQADAVVNALIKAGEL